MNIRLNGEAKELASSISLKQLLENLQILPGRVACEVNLKIIKRPHYADTYLKEGDEVEIIQAIGGG